MHNLIVVVNDEPIQLTSLCAILQSDGFEVRSFENAIAALEDMSDKPPPALIITDLHMPVINGFRFCQLLRSPEYAVFNNVPILVVSAISFGAMTSKLSIEAGADEFLYSPVQAKILISTTHALIQSRSANIKYKAIIIEDERSIAHLMRVALEHGGYYVRLAATISDALEEFKTMSFDLAVIDNNLPDGNGSSMIEEVRKKHTDCICIMITDDISPKLALKWMRSGADGYARKPFKPDYLLSLCSRAFRERAFLRIENTLEQQTKTLRKQQEQHLILINNTLDFIYSLDREGRHTAVNRSVCDALNLNADEIIGKNHADLGFSENIVREWRALHEKVFSSEQPLSSETRVVMPDGNEHIYEIGLFPILNDTGHITGLRGVSRDITKKKLIEENLLTAEMKYRTLIETERKKLGADLHDTICQQVIGIGFLAKRISQISENIGNKVPDIAREIGHVSAECLNTIRELASGINPLPNKDSHAFHNSLLDLASYIELTFTKQCLYRPSKPIIIKNDRAAENLFLIVREAVLNTAKHSNGRLIKIDVSKHGDTLTFSVTSNGTFKRSPLKDAKRTTGLDTMRLRAEVIGADLTIEHTPGQDIKMICKWKEKE